MTGNDYAGDITLHQQCASSNHAGKNEDDSSDEAEMPVLLETYQQAYVLAALAAQAQGKGILEAARNHDMGIRDLPSEMPAITIQNLNKHLGLPMKPGLPGYKVQLCMHHEKDGFCAAGSNCTFAHGMDELGKRLKELGMPPVKSVMCKFFVRGRCDKGDKCLYAHTSNELSEQDRALLEERFKEEWAGPQWRAGDWYCLDCGAHQFKQNVKCRRCGSFRRREDTGLTLSKLKGAKDTE